MKKRQIGKLGLVLLAGILMAGCGKTKEEAKAPKYTIGVVTKSKSSEYWMSVCSGMEDAAEKENAEVVILSPDSETDQKTQKKMIKDCPQNISDSAIPGYGHRWAYPAIQ